MERLEKKAFQVKSTASAKVLWWGKLGVLELSEGAGEAEVGECGGGRISRTKWRRLDFIVAMKTLWKALGQEGHYPQAQFSVISQVGNVSGDKQKTADSVSFNPDSLTPSPAAALDAE